jgi:predicted DNA-binding transcriptional regulator YafY
MDLIEKIREAGGNLNTIEINYNEKDGSNEGWREVEPYSFKTKKGVDYFYGFDVAKNGTRSFIVESIVVVEITDNSYDPRWPVEV